MCKIRSLERGIFAVDKWRALHSLHPVASNASSIARTASATLGSEKSSGFGNGFSAAVCSAGFSVSGVGLAAQGSTLQPGSKRRERCL